jgi:hypothetical protein
MGLPYVPGAIRQLLLADSAFTAAVGGRCTVKKSPPDVTSPFAVVQIPGGAPLDEQGWVLQPLIQVNVWCPDSWAAADPDVVAWDGISAVRRVLQSARYVTYSDTRGSMTYSARITDGPLPTEDTTRGDSTPLQGYLLRAELTLQDT